MSVDVVGLGTCNVDFIMKVPRFLKADDEVDIEKLNLSLGGSASNFTVGLSRLDIKTGIISRIGNDFFGRYSMKKLKEEGVDIKRLQIGDESTGMAFIAVDSLGERSMYTFIGANQNLILEKEDIKYIRASKVLHISGMYKEVVDEASKYANLLSLNPGTILSSFGIESLRKILKRSQIMFLSKKEVSILTGEEIGDGARILVDLGIPMVVVTLGSKGANLYTKEGVIYSPARNVKALDTTGAGDVFAAGFIASFIREQSLQQCLDFANSVASRCVRKFGATSFP